MLEMTMDEFFSPIVDMKLSSTSERCMKIVLIVCLASETFLGGSIGAIRKIDVDNGKFR
jgi:hypothetical protein